MLILTGPIVEGTTGRPHYVNNWTAPPGPSFEPPHQTSGVHLTYKPTLFDLTTMPLPHHQDTTLSLPSDDTTPLLPDIDYFALTEVGTAMSWDSDVIKTSNLAALDTLEKTFGSYIYLQ